MEDLEIAEFIKTGFYIKAGSYTNTAALAWLTYDSLLTFGDEIELIWSRPRSFGSILYIVARYSEVASLITQVLSAVCNFNGASAEFMAKIFWASIPFNFAMVLSLRLLLIGRAYAVSSGNRVIGIGFILLLLVNIVQMIVQDTLETLQPHPKIYSTIVLLGAIFALVTDGAVTAVTAYYAWQEARNFRRLFGRKRQSLTVVFLQQGVIRFLIIFSWLLETALNEKLLSPFLSGVDVSLQIAMSNILLCRFMLELRKFNQHMQTVPSVHLDPQVQSHDSPRRPLGWLHDRIIMEFANSEVSGHSPEDREGEDG